MKYIKTKDANNEDAGNSNLKLLCKYHNRKISSQDRLVLRSPKGSRGKTLKTQANDKDIASPEKDDKADDTLRNVGSFREYLVEPSLESIQAAKA